MTDAQIADLAASGAEATQDAPLRVVVVDDDALARRLLRDILQEAGCTVIAEAANGRDALELCAYYHPDVVVMDVVLPGMDGVEATRRLLADGSDATKVVMLTSCADEEVALECLRAGAVGYLSKDIDLTSLPRVLEAARRGEALVSRRMTMRLIESVRAIAPNGVGMRPVRSPLTSREWEVLDLLCDGRSTDAVATELVLSVETVRSHIKSILRKLDVRSREEAVDVTRRLRTGRPSPSAHDLHQPAA